MLRLLTPGLLGVILQSETSLLDSVRTGFLPVAYAVLLITLLVVVIALVVALFRALGSGDVPKVESWEGFGGGLGGWQVSRSLALLVGVAVFASLAAVTVRTAATDLQPSAPAAQQPAVDSAALSPAPDSTATGADSAKKDTKQEPRPEPRQTRRPAPATAPATTTTAQ
jgi:hypothetical protein